MSVSSLTEIQDEKLIEVIDKCEDFFLRNKRGGKYTPTLWKCVITLDYEETKPVENYRFAGRHENKWIAINEALNKALEEFENVS